MRLWLQGSSIGWLFLAVMGDTIDPNSILSLPGDVEHGRQIFFAGSANSCQGCHRIEGKGTEIGPDLSKIGAKYAKPELLRHILQPSLLIEPPYRTYLLETKSGRIVTGLIAEKTDREVVLKDVKGQLIRVPASDVADLVPSPKSMMPDLLLRDLTAQQAADLLDFLATRK
jgi:putative heme-binding domain-containing protein